MGNHAWDTLCSRGKSDYGFDPVKDGELVGAERLGSRAKPAWQTAWKRFAAMPSRYAGLVDLLRKAKPSSPSGDLLASLPSEAWPQDNEAEVAELRQALQELPALPVAKARVQLYELERKHGARRIWVWAKLGLPPRHPGPPGRACVGRCDRRPAGPPPAGPDPGIAAVGHGHIARSPGARLARVAGVDLADAHLATRYGPHVQGAMAAIGGAGGARGVTTAGLNDHTRASAPPPLGP